MSDVGYLYPQWEAAKRKLIQALHEPGAQSQIGAIVHGFFSSHVFELSASYSVSGIMLERSLIDDLEKHVNRKNMAFLADRCLELGLYMKRTHPTSDRGIETVHSILVFGSPSMIGRGTRESAKESPHG